MAAGMISKWRDISGASVYWSNEELQTYSLAILPTQRPVADPCWHPGKQESARKEDELWAYTLKRASDQNNDENHELYRTW